MALTRRPTPLTELVSLRDAMERLFDERFFRPIWTAGEHEIMPALDLYTTEEAVIARMALPGVKAEDVDIQITDDTVTITGSFKEEKEMKEAGYIHRELNRGSFTRTFSMPNAVKADKATATFKDGMLTLTLPKTEETKPKHVKVELT